MKKAIIMLLVACLLVTTVPRPQAHAEVLTITTIAAAAFAVAVASGIVFTFTNGTAAGAQAWMEDQLRSYLGNQSITDLFGLDTIAATGGALLIGNSVYNGILDFLDWLLTENDVQAGGTDVTEGTFDGKFLYVDYQGDIGDQIGSSPIGVTFWGTSGTNGYGYINGRSYANGNWTLSNPMSTSASFPFTGIYYYGIDSAGTLTVNLRRVKSYGDDAGVERTPLSAGLVPNVQLDNIININKDAYDGPDVLNPDKEWKGTVDGAAPDTNIDQLCGNIFNDVSQNDIVIDDEVVDTPLYPTPVPTTAPTTAPADDVLEGINDLIGQQDQIIAGQDAIAQDVEGIKEGVESIDQAIADSLAVPDEEAIEDYKFDLHTLFPFCIPWDIYALVTCFDAEPITPSVQIPFNVPVANLYYTFDLDLHDFDGLAAVLRNLELISFGVGLAILTSKVIRW